MSDQYCLKWNNHHTTIVAVFDKLFECESLVDCTLAAEGKYLKAHKVVLSACSSYLEDLLQSHEDKHPILIFNDISYVELKAMLEYMYRGEVNVSQDQLNTFLKAAEALRIKGLTTDQGGGGGGGGSSSDGDGGGNELKRKASKKEPSSGGNASSSARAHSPALGTTTTTSNDRPSSPKRKRRASSRDENFANDSNSYDTAPTPPSSGQNAVTKLEEKLRLKRESSETPSAASSHGGVPHKLLQPKTEFIEDPSNVEDVSLEDEEDYGPNPGTSQASFSSQDFNSWQMGETTGDEVFMGQHEMNNTAGNSQVKRRHLCVKCNRTYGRRDHLTRHWANSSCGGGDNYSLQSAIFCNVCGKQFSRKDHLVRHKKRSCGRARKYHCSMCSHVTENKKHLVSHMLVVHGVVCKEPLQPVVEFATPMAATFDMIRQPPVAAAPHPQSGDLQSTRQQLHRQGVEIIEPSYEVDEDFNVKIEEDEGDDDDVKYADDIDISEMDINRVIS